MQQALRGRKLPLQIEYENILGVDFHISLRHQKATPARLQPGLQQKGSSPTIWESVRAVANVSGFPSQIPPALSLLSHGFVLGFSGLIWPIKWYPIGTQTLIKCH